MTCCGMIYHIQKDSWSLDAYNPKNNVFKFLSLVTCHSSRLSPTPWSCICRVCISSLILSSASCSRRSWPTSSILFRSCHKQREMILKYSEHIQRREEVKSYHLIGTCGNLWIFLRGVLGIRSRLITMRQGVRSDAHLNCTETWFQKCSQSG